MRMRMKETHNNCRGQMHFARVAVCAIMITSQFSLRDLVGMRVAYKP